MAQMNLSTKQKQNHKHREQTCGCQEGGEWGPEGLVGSQGLADVNQYIRMDKQQGPTVYHRVYIQYSMINHNGKEYEKGYVCTNHFAVPEINTTL